MCCDGWTYPNECIAGGAGVNVAYKGECVAGPESGTLSGHIYDGTAECPSGECAVPFADIIISEGESDVLRDVACLYAKNYM